MGLEFRRSSIFFRKKSYITFAANGTKNVRLIATNTVGCIDTIIKQVPIVNEPPITLGFKDTLICTGDPTTLAASGTGQFSWSPSTNVLNPNTGSPTVAPRTTTTYIVTMNDNGCINTASVIVRVTDRVNLKVMADTAICQGDTIQLRVESDAFKYAWLPNSQVINTTAKSPLAVTNNALTTYRVVANIGSCTAQGQISVSTTPYPVVAAGRDTTICFNTPALLRGSSNGDSIRGHLQ
jgi:hypothetical protein